MAAQRQSFWVALTRAGLTAAAALALTRVFGQSSWLGAIVFAAFLPAIVFAIAERRRWHAFAPLAIVVVVGFWLALVVDDPSDTIGSIPTPAALSTLSRDLGRAPHVLRSATVPVPPFGAALVLAVVATLVTALATELVARRLEAPIGAIGPSVALYVAVSALGSGRWAPSTAVYALAVIAYLIALHHAELSTRRTWFQNEHKHRSNVVAGGIVAGALVVALAIALGPTFPGARSGAWINYRSLGSGKGASILKTESPLVSVRDKLQPENRDKEVFTVKTTDPRQMYWRVIALDKFKNDDWGLDAARDKGTNLSGPTNPPGATLVEDTFHLGNIDPLWLPAAYRPVRIDLKGASMLPGSTSLFLEGKPLSDLTYTVDSEVVSPAKPALEAVTQGEIDDKSDDTNLPPGFSKRVIAEAQRVTASAATPYEKGLALENYFLYNGGFKYDQTVKLGTSTSAIDEFLFDKKAGFCEQFATAFAEMARAVNLPARVAVGYQHGTSGNDGLLHVAERDAHAWPEVWMGSTIGWYAFEPTPGRANPITGQGDKTPASIPNNPGATTTTTTPSTRKTTPNTAAKPTTPNSQPKNISVLPPTTKKTSHTGARVLTGLGIAVALAIIGLIGALIALFVAARRRTQRRRTDPDPRRRVLGAWTEALEQLTAAGVERRPSATSIEFALRQAPAHGAGAAGPPLMDLARLHTAAMYAAEPPTADDADGAWADVDAIEGALRESVPRTTRWRNRLFGGRREKAEREREPVMTSD